MPLLIVGLFLCFVFLLFVWGLLTEHSLSEQIISLFIFGCAYIVVTLEIASLLHQLNTPTVVLGIQLLLTLGAALFLWKPFLQKIRSTFRKPLVLHNPNRALGTLLFVFLSLVAVIYIFLAYLAIKFPQNTADVLYNHLSRIGYWLQQGSLLPYNGFNNIGSTYPYNNSLLMLWPIIFIQSDIAVGFVQYSALIIIGFVIFRFSNLLGFSRRSSIYSASVILTFPIVLFESITAQNDILAACFIGVAFLFVLLGRQKSSLINIIISALAYALAIGTKQYAIFMFPGYLALVVWAIVKSKRDRLIQVKCWGIGFFVSLITIGSFSYLQNFIYNQPLFGASDNINYQLNHQPFEQLLNKSIINSVRIATQFLSCEGLTPSLEISCSHVKGKLLSPLFVNDILNIESDHFLLEEETPFFIANIYPLNEESSWYGPLGWILLIPGLFHGLITSIKRKQIASLIMIIFSLVYFVIIASFKKGWDPYLGRYFLPTTVLLMPFTSFIFDSSRLHRRILAVVICSLSIFISVNSLINNYSRPLIGRTMFYRTQWEKYPYLEGVAYQLFPIIRNDMDVWSLEPNEIRTITDRSYYSALDMVEEFIPEGTSLGIVAREGFFLDYLFFGNNFGRKIFAIKDGLNMEGKSNTHYDYLLLSPGTSNVMIETECIKIDERENWQLLRCNK